MMGLPDLDGGEKFGRTESKLRVFWIWVLGIGIPLALIVAEASPLGSDLFFVVLGIPFALIVWAVNSILATVLAVRLVRSGLWHQALPMLIFLLLLVAGVIAPWSLLHTMIDIGDELHFLVMRSTYLKEIRALPLTGEHRLVEFDLGGMIWAHSAIMYDESDELALPPDQRSQVWKDRMSTIDVCEPDAQPLLILQHTELARHFYLASFAC